MSEAEPRQGPILRIFEVKAKPGHAAELIAKFGTTSAAVVDGHPGNQGYFFGPGIGTDSDRAIFVSLWADLTAVQQRFGMNWQRSYLPEGYEDLIESCSVQHIDASKGWNARLDAGGN